MIPQADERDNRKGEVKVKKELVKGVPEGGKRLQYDDKKWNHRLEKNISECITNRATLGVP